MGEEEMMYTILAGVALSGALGILAGIFEDLESDTGSQSNPNSQVQLAPQIGHLHRYFNKAISGEPPAYGLWCVIAATIAVRSFQSLPDLFDFGFRISDFGLIPHSAFRNLQSTYTYIVASVIGSIVSAVILSFYAIFSHLSRTASMQSFKQPLQLDVILNPLLLLFSYGFLSILSVTLLSFVTNVILGNPFPVPLIALLYGITLGTIGSSTGDVMYGAERLYQTYIFGSGIPISKQGDIDVKAEYGYRNSVDTPYFTMRFGALVTGLCFGILIFLDNWSRLFNFIGEWTPIIIGLIILIVLFGINYLVEVYARRKYGKFI
ncbi:MAG: tetrahydromethanopterin S-methyltransferase subunit E [Methanosarcinales archaeon]